MGAGKLKKLPTAKNLHAMLLLLPLWLQAIPKDSLTDLRRGLKVKKLSELSMPLTTRPATVLKFK